MMRTPQRKFSRVYIFDMETYETLYEESYLWSGVIGQMKKGRGEQQAILTQQLNQAQQEGPQFQEAETPMLSAYDSYIPSGPNTFSPAVGAQYDSDLANLKSTYGNLAKSGFQTLAQRGFGSAPTGAASSLDNTLKSQEGNEEAQAYRNAQVNNTNQGFNALAGKQSALNLFNPSTPLNGGSASASNLNKMGSTLSDIATGIGSAASSAAGVMTGMGNM